VCFAWLRVIRGPNILAQEGIKTTLDSRKGYKFSELSYAVIGACHDVQHQLGVHCMEVDYQRALETALSKLGLSWEREVHIPIAYDGIVVTRRRVDYVIRGQSGELIMETKAASEIRPEDVEQCVLYLHQGGYCPLPAG